jgi:hypothetical protein
MDNLVKSVLLSTGVATKSGRMGKESDQIPPYQNWTLSTALKMQVTSDWLKLKT